jgi:hypothetical protein
LYLGLATLADDHGFLLWRPVAIGAALFPYQETTAREAHLQASASALIDVELLVIHGCGCAQLPRFDRDLAQKGGTRSFSVEEFHGIHVRTSTDKFMSGRVRTNPSRDWDRVGIGLGSGEGSGDPRIENGPSILTRDPVTADNRWERPGDDPTDRVPGRPDIEALVRRWGRVTLAQRAVLDEVLGRHDVNGSAWAVDVVERAQGNEDPLACIMAADQEWQADRGREADEHDRAWQTAKAEEARLADGIVEVLETSS